MALTRSMLKGMNLTDEQVSAIIEEHTNTIDGLKADRDRYKAEAAKVPDLQKKIDAYASGDDWQKKYNDEKKAFDDYKKAIAGKEQLAKVQSAYKALLKSSGVDEKRIDSIVKVTDFADLKLNEKGEFDNAEELTKNIRSEWSGFIVSQGTKGADIKTPPGNTGATMTREQIMKIKDGAERRKAIAENPSLFGLSSAE